ncbi:purine catabolism regulatory protein [Halopseudomonas litoralis]|uniref:Purine catabolism regulatory protein n=1 Tax=Halopseudomonas litoralis TaxID=797277 RepID=A0A1H1QHD5_9GAMM|nr:PucR family transcriptional regulator ligand-binding domain-containing protein [Halopseudomonas litoralis]SDS22941.1 purine catabolism regulatory protein [Halopseudomonas litoralis]
MQLQIIDIVQTSELQTRFLAGAKGSQRLVGWAHVCELAEPTEWLGGDDLLMTTGLGIPAGADKQRIYIEKLAAAGLAGIMIGENMQAPDDLTALKEAADRLDFPVLLTQYGIPFSSVTRAIIDAERNREFERRNAFNRLSTTARMAIQGQSLAQLIARLETDISASLMILDPQQSNTLWHPHAMAMPAELKESLSRQPLDFADNQPAIRRYMLSSGEMFATLIPSARNLVLLVHNKQQKYFDYSLLHHLAAVVSISIEHLYMGLERSLRLGSQLLDDLLSQRLTPYQSSKQISDFQLELESACIAITRPEDRSLITWGVQLQRMQVPVIFRLTGDDITLLAHPDNLPIIQRVVGSALGVSTCIGDYQRLPEALREARLALLHADTPSCWFYSEIIDRAPWLPNNLDEATHTFRRILGPLEEHDKAQGSSLLHSLKVFLEQNRSWVAAARQLHIHKTTLVYRIRKIESLTNRSLDKTEDVAILWLAFKSGELAGLFTSE